MSMQKRKKKRDWGENEKGMEKWADEEQEDKLSEIEGPAGPFYPLVHGFKETHWENLSCPGRVELGDTTADSWFIFFHNALCPTSTKDSLPLNKSQIFSISFI
jgi:hypothetical protein